MLSRFMDTITVITGNKQSEQDRVKYIDKVVINKAGINIPLVGRSKCNVTPLNPFISAQKTCTSIQIIILSH